MPVTIEFIDKPYVEITILEGSTRDDIEFAKKFAKHLKQNGWEVKLYRIIRKYNVNLKKNKPSLLMRNRQNNIKYTY